MDANSGAPWSEMDISDLTNELARGQTMAQTASFLCRDEDEVRQKARDWDWPRASQRKAPPKRGIRRFELRGEPPHSVLLSGLVRR